MILTQALSVIALVCVQDGAAPATSKTEASKTEASKTAAPKNDDWQEMDCVMMIVNEEIITRRTMGRDYFLLKRERPPANDDEALRLQNDILTDNVKEKLRIQAGQDMGLDEAQVDRQVRDYLERETEVFSGVVGL